MKYQNKETLARAVVEQVVRGRPVPVVSGAEVGEALRAKGACFVTLYVDGRLHGCIGTIEVRQPLFQDIMENALGAATRDWRFPPLTTDELDRLTVEVSVLTVPEQYDPVSNAALLKDLERDKPGLILEKDGRRAVFLPQVWEQLPTAEVFLMQLCLKAGLDPGAWREGMRFRVFRVQA